MAHCGRGRRQRRGALRQPGPGRGRPHISYYDTINGDLKYAHYDGAAWHLEVVDSADDVGGWCAIALETAGRPRITYLDATNADLKYAAFDGAAWHFQVVDSAGYVGWHSSLALDAQGHIWLAALEDLVVEYDPGEQKRYGVEHVTAHVELPTSRSNPPIIWGIAADRKTNHLWIATSIIVDVAGETWRSQMPQYQPSAVLVDAEGYKAFAVVSYGNSSIGLLVLAPTAQGPTFSPPSLRGIARFPVQPS